jgi:5'-nucleotidase
VSPNEAEGFEVTRLGRRVYQDQLIERVDPRGIPYFWIGGPPPSGLAVPGTDFHAVINRRIAVTPIHLDLTGRSLLRRLKTWSWSLEPTAGQIGKEAAKPPGHDRPEAAAAEDELTDEGKTERR